MKPTQTAKNVTGNFEDFTKFARRIMAVPRSAIQPQLDAEKAKRTSRAYASSRAPVAASKKS